MTPTNDSLAQPEAAGDNSQLGEWLGRRQAFAAVAGRCSAADAECMRRIRDDKMYLERAKTWDDFCSRLLGMTRQNADRIIRLLEELGPAYFQLAQLTRVSPEVYREIAPAMSEDGLCIHGDVIALDASNSNKLAAAVAQLRAPKPAPPVDRWARLETAERQFVSITKELIDLSKGEGEGPDRFKTIDVLRQMRTRLYEVELEI